MGKDWLLHYVQAIAKLKKINVDCVVDYSLIFSERHTHCARGNISN